MFSSMQVNSMKRVPPEFLRRYLFFSEINWDSLPPTELELIRKNKSIINLRRNEVLYEDGTSPKGVYQVVKGKIKLFIRMSEGVEQIVFLYTQGEAFGFRPLIAGEKQP